jgi:hypothetical protein
MQRHIVGAKLIEVLGRGLFVVFCTYRLPLKEAGDFGLVATLLTMAAFALGYERQVAVMREVAGAPAPQVHQRLRETLRFHALHACWLVPLLALIAALWFRWPAEQLLLLLPILLAEYAANQAYQVVLISARNTPLLHWVALRSAGLAVTALLVAWWLQERFSLPWVLGLWAGLSTVFLFAIRRAWRRLPGKSAEPIAELPPKPIRSMYRDSALHFLVGSVAVAALQLDRIVAGLSLSADDIGLYFRHVTLAALALQCFNIASYNRVAPGVYALVREGHLERSRAVVWIEFRRFALLTLASAAAVLGLDRLYGLPSARFGLVHDYLAILGLAVLLRAGADYLGLLLLAQSADAALLRNQAVAVAAGAGLLLALAQAYGLVGALFGAVGSPLVYLCLNRLSLPRPACTP